MPDDFLIPPISDSALADCLDLIKHGIGVFDSSLCLIKANRAFRDLMEYPASLCMAGTSLQSFIAFDCRRGLYGQSEHASIMQQLDAVLSSRSHSSSEIYLQNGRVVELDFRKAADGCLIAVFTNITRAMRASEQKERDGAIIRQLPDAVVLTDLNYRILYFNPAFQRMFLSSFQKSEARYLPPHGIRARIGYNDFIAELEDAIARRGRHDFEIDILDTSRKRRTLQGLIMPRRDVSLGHVGYLGLYRDITVQARDRRRLERQDRVIAQLSEAVIITDQFGYTRDCNPAVEKMYGYGLNDLKGKRFLDVVSPGDDATRKLADHIVTTLLNGNRWNGEIFLKRKNGETILADCNVQPFYDDQGNHIGMIGVHRDVTERQRAQDEILRQTMVIEHLSEAVVVTDTDGNIQEYNASARRLFGLSGSTGGFEKVHHELVTIARNVTRNGRFEVTYSIVSPESDDVHLECLAMPVKARDGSVERIVSVHRDVSEKVRRQREQAQQAEHRERSRRLETLGQIAGGIAHDFNNILTPILGYSHLVRNALKPKSKPHADMDLVIAGMEKARDMVRQILMFGQKIDPPLNPEQIDDILSSTLDLLSGSIPENVELDFSPGCKGIALPCNKTLIGQLVLNLCYNAIQAMPEGGKLILGSDRKGNWKKVRREHSLATADEGLPHIRFWVEDTGIGISEKDIDRIFEPFYTTKGSGKGTGLGLSVAHGVVRAHDGVILVKSARDKGTRFEVFLPIKPCLENSEPKSDTDSIKGNGERILIVDDDPKVRELLIRMLEERNYKADCASDGREALNLISAENAYELILSDLSMPDINGETLVKDLRASGIKIPFILMSAMIDARTLRSFKEWGIDALLHKPLVPNDLFKAIHQHIHMHETTLEKG